MNRREPLSIANCADCKKSTPALQRRYLGCGYEPPLDERVRLTVWQPPHADAGHRNGYTGPELTTCAGFTCNLPEVTEVALARVHWSKGNMSFHETPEPMLDALVILEGSYNQLQAWLTTPAKEGGGGS